MITKGDCRFIGSIVSLEEGAARVQKVNGDEIIYMNSGDWLESLSSLEYVDNKWSIYNHTRTEANFNNDEGSRVEMTTKELYKDMIEEFKILNDK